MFVRIGALLSLFPAVLLLAQTPVALSPAEANVWQHRIGPLTAIHITADEVASAGRFWNMVDGYVGFDIVVSPNGIVESATLISNHKYAPAVSAHLEEARVLELARRYKPWIRDGAPVRVHLQDGVEMLPPERWSDKHAGFPGNVDLSEVSIGLTRTSCYGACPDYSLTIAGNGVVKYHGDRWVVISGDHTAKVPPETVRELLNLFRKADFFSALDRYHANVTDNPTQKISLTIGPLSKTITDYVGLEAGLPLVIRNLEDQIDDAVDSARWVRGNSNTLASLKEEGWNFAATDPENIALYNLALALPRREDTGLTHEQSVALREAFVSAKAPILAGDSDHSSPVCTASLTGEFSLVQRMTRGIRTFPQSVVDECVLFAAHSGDEETFNFWMDHGADLHAEPPTHKDESWSRSGILVNALDGRNPVIVRRILDAGVALTVPNQPRASMLAVSIESSNHAKDFSHLAEILTMLLQAGADPNHGGRNGGPMLFTIGLPPEAVKPLLTGGADIEARERGETPLMAHAYSEPLVRELLADGADPDVKDPNGKTALSIAREKLCGPCVNLIQAAIEKKNTAAH